MRKDSAERDEETYWIVAPPSGHCGQLREPQSQCGKAHTHTTGALRGSDTSYSEIK